MADAAAAVEANLGAVSFGSKQVGACCIHREEICTKQIRQHLTLPREHSCGWEAGNDNALLEPVLALGCIASVHCLDGSGAVCGCCI